MQKATLKPIQVTYSYVDGAHFFFSTDPIAKGLCVASANLHVAFIEVSKQLNVLLQKNHKIEQPLVHEAVTFSEFKHWLDQAVAVRESHITPLPGAIVDWKLSKTAA